MIRLLMWRIEHGKHIKLYEKLEQEGRATPLREVPSFDQISSWYLDVFAILSNSRSGGEHPNPIALSEIICYANNFDIIGNKESLIDVIQTLDQKFLTHLSNKAEKSQKRVNKK